MTTVNSLYYSQWRHMRGVTSNPHYPKYDIYGAQGITCYWDSGCYKEFESWLITTLGHRPSPKHLLGRKNKKTGHFAPGNLQWELPIERSNRNFRQNVLVKMNGRSQTIAQWSRELDINYYVLRRRLSQGYRLRDIIKAYK